MSAASKDETNTEKKDTETKPSTDKPKTDAERAAARAARFGGSVSSEVEAKKQARAARFGIKSGKSWYLILKFLQKYFFL